jgi:hypothetical protein
MRRIALLAGLLGFASAPSAFAAASTEQGWPLRGVSCRPALCTAVGFHDAFTLAERFS